MHNFIGLTIIHVVSCLGPKNLLNTHINVYFSLFLIYYSCQWFFFFFKRTFFFFFKWRKRVKRSWNPTCRCWLTVESLVLRGRWLTSLWWGFVRALETWARVTPVHPLTSLPLMLRPLTSLPLMLRPLTSLHLMLRPLTRPSRTPGQTFTSSRHSSRTPTRPTRTGTSRPSTDEPRPQQSPAHRPTKHDTQVTWRHRCGRSLGWQPIGVWLCFYNVAIMCI